MYGYVKFDLNDMEQFHNILLFLKHIQHLFSTHTYFTLEPVMKVFIQLRECIHFAVTITTPSS